MKCVSICCEFSHVTDLKRLCMLSNNNVWSISHTNVCIASWTCEGLNFHVCILVMVCHSYVRPYHTLFFPSLRSTSRGWFVRQRRNAMMHKAYLHAYLRAHAHTPPFTHRLTHTCKQACTITRTDALMHAPSHMHISSRTHAWMHTSTHASTHSNRDTHIHMNTVYMHVLLANALVHACMHACTYVPMHAHKHPHTHTCTSVRTQCMYILPTVVTVSWMTMLLQRSFQFRSVVLFCISSH